MGYSSHVHRGLPEKFESSDLSGDNVSREIGRVAYHDMKHAGRRGGIALDRGQSLLLLLLL